jgi:hypothetical protein
VPDGKEPACGCIIRKDQEVAALWERDILQERVPHQSIIVGSKAAVSTHLALSPASEPVVHEVMKVGEYSLKLITSRGLLR